MKQISPGWMALIIGLIFFSLGAVLVHLGAQRYFAGTEVPPGFERVVGTMISVDTKLQDQFGNTETTRGLRRIYSVRVAYQSADGVERIYAYETRWEEKLDYPDLGPRPEVGLKIKLLYSKQDPSRAEIDITTQHFKGALPIFSFGALIMLIACGALWTAYREYKEWRRPRERWNAEAPGLSNARLMDKIERNRRRQKPRP